MNNSWNIKFIYKILVIIIIGTGVFLFGKYYNKNYSNTVKLGQPEIVTVDAPIPAVEKPNGSVNQDINTAVGNNFQPPLDRAKERMSKKPFGIFITPQTSPVQLEKFYGYHTGVDFEIFPEELNVDVPIQAVCSGKLEMKKYATGYGGVAVESCDLNGQAVTVIYGHLKLASIVSVVGADLKAGDVIGILGKAYSSETSGERKHLHLGFHKGANVNILGYVQNKSELLGWLDPCLYVCGN